MEPKAPGMKYLPLLVFQFVLVALFFVFVKYDGDNHHQLRGFEDTHVMIYIGFGFLMTFLKKYCYSALGFNWLLAALVAQWSLLTQGWFNMKDMVIPLNKETIVEADIMAATVLITFGALLGVASGGQLLFIAIVETAIASANIYLVSTVLKAADVGGSIAIHSFGAYFGLGVSLALRTKKVEGQAEKNVLNGPTYISDVTAMIGSIFLYIYWPSFNSALTGTDEEYQRAVTNTYLSLASCTVVTFILSSLLSHERGKFDMVHIQNSTLAGGVAVGSVCNMHVQAGGAILIGIGAAFISVVGYRFLTPKLEKLGLLDTCGVNNLHGMPGLYSGLLSVLFAALATTDTYGETGLNSVFEAMKADNTYFINKKGKYCSYCGRYTIRVSTTCPHCRANWSRRLGRCRNCEAAIDPEWSYCEICGVETARAQRLKRAKMLSHRAKLQKVAHTQLPPPPQHCPKSPDLFGPDPDMDEVESFESTLSSDQQSRTTPPTNSTNVSDDTENDVVADIREN